MKKLYSRNNIAVTKITKTGILFIFLLSVFLIPNTTYSQEHHCDAQLDFINDRPNKKAGQSGQYYRMKLTNNGDSGTFIISIDNIKPSKENVSSVGNSIDLNNKVIVFQLLERIEISPKDNNSKRTGKLYEVVLRENEEFLFYVKLETPKEAKIGSRNSTRVEVISSNCPDLNIYKILNTEIIDGE